MVEAALNAAAEQLVEFTAYGRLMQRDGNRAPEAAPQGLYPCKDSAPGHEHWIALSIVTDAQWRALTHVLGEPLWATDPALDTLAGRRALHDDIDRELRPWIAARPLDGLVDKLLAAGIPAGRVRDPRQTSDHPQLAARRFYEEVLHPLVGSQPTPTLPFRYASVDHWLRNPAPTLGQHSREILLELGVAPDEIDQLEADHVIGTRPLAA